MSTVVKKQHRRKPFGTSAGNALILKKRPSASAVNKSSNPKEEAAAEKRRDSKTPKTSNLTAAGGAYDLSKEFGVDQQHRRHKRGSKHKTKPSKKGEHHPRVNLHRPPPTSKSKPDPSPIKRPDPSSSLPDSKTKRSSKSNTKSNNGGNNNKRDGFVTASLKRLFPSKASSKSNNEQQQTKSTKNNKNERSLDPTDPSSDMDTTCSTQQPKDEDNSPLITSPLAKPDPIGQGEEEEKDVTNHDEMTDDVRRKATTKPVAASKNSHGTASKSHPSRALVSSQRMTETNQPSLNVPKEVLDRARHGHIDNKRVLDAMFKSGVGANPSSRHRHPKQHHVDNESLVGSIIDVHRSDSVDESEVTTLDDYPAADEDESQSSMTTRADYHHDDVVAETGIAPYRGNYKSLPEDNIHRVAAAAVAAAPQGKTSSVSDIFRAQVKPTSHYDNATEQPPRTNSNHQELQRSNTIESQTALELHQQPLILTAQLLPSGWKTKWSKTKQRPYYAHPDFGTTWHCPGWPTATTNQHCQEKKKEEKSHQVMSSNNNESFFPTQNSSARANIGLNSYATQMPKNDTRKAENNYDDCGDMSYQQPVQSSNNLDSDSNPTHRNNASSTSDDGSSKCFTQDFESFDNQFEMETQYAKQRHDYGTNDEEPTLENETDSPEQHHHHHHNDDDNNDPVEFDNYHGGFDDDNLNDDDEIASQHQSHNDGEDDQPLDQQHNENIDGASVLSTIDEEQNEINSLVSDHVDVDALLQSKKMKKKISSQSPMPTIKELRVESAQSSQVSPDDVDDDAVDASVDELAGLKVLQRDNSFETESIGVLSFVANKHEKEVKEEHTVDNDEDDFGGNDDQSPMFDSNDNGGIEEESMNADINDGDSFIGGRETEESLYDVNQSKSRGRRKRDGITGLNLDAELKKESRKASSSRRGNNSLGPKKKIFPPGPLCSLQFLEEIESKEFDTPLWRRMKRKRSTLESVNRGKAIKREKQRRRATSYT